MDATRFDTATITPDNICARGEILAHEIGAYLQEVHENAEFPLSERNDNDTPELEISEELKEVPKIPYTPSNEAVRLINEINNTLQKAESYLVMPEDNREQHERKMLLLGGMHLFRDNAPLRFSDYEIASDAGVIGQLHTDIANLQHQFSKIEPDPLLKEKTDAFHREVLAPMRQLALDSRYRWEDKFIPTQYSNDAPLQLHPAHGSEKTPYFLAVLKEYDARNAGLPKGLHHTHIPVLENTKPAPLVEAEEAEAPTNPDLSTPDSNEEPTHRMQPDSAEGNYSNRSGHGVV